MSINVKHVNHKNGTFSISITANKGSLLLSEINRDDLYKLVHDLDRPLYEEDMDNLYESLQATDDVVENMQYDEMFAGK